MIYTTFGPATIVGRTRAEKDKVLIKLDSGDLMWRSIHELKADGGAAEVVSTMESKPYVDDFGIPEAA